MAGLTAAPHRAGPALTPPRTAGLPPLSDNWYVQRIGGYRGYGAQNATVRPAARHTAEHRVRQASARP
ncbi:hypothetical protein [Streptomyces inhibens]|uniref:hypothetical protein n=1 Tax=Streptomyces inhibens TaxID=2293571 RepID=UPI001EE6B7F6|nr:hypothetical protein [Streptomyces inhibens]UKY48742.1 hypothetical protein KI385_07980 [Streptomyces inhibens]